MDCVICECMACGLLFFKSEAYREALGNGDEAEECLGCHSEDIFPFRLIHCTNCGMTAVQATFFHEEELLDPQPKLGIKTGYYHEWDKDCIDRDENAPPICNSYKWQMIDWQEFLKRRGPKSRLVHCEECGMIATQDCFFPNHLPKRRIPQQPIYLDYHDPLTSHVHRWIDKKDRQRGCGSARWKFVDLSSLYTSLRRKK